MVKQVADSGTNLRSVSKTDKRKQHRIAKTGTAAPPEAAMPSQKHAKKCAAPGKKGKAPAAATLLISNSLPAGPPAKTGPLMAVNGILNISTARKQTGSAGQRTDSRTAACSHCGEPCPEPLIAEGRNSFCCRGCRTVYELLTGNGLGLFYELSEQPGVRIRKTPPPHRWAYLDEPSLRERLLDFSGPKTSRVTFHVPAIHCVACVWLLENLCHLNPGIGQARVDFSRRELALCFDTQALKLSEVVELLDSLGYEPELTLEKTGKPAVQTRHRRQWIQIGLAGFAFGNIMLLSLPGYFGLDSFSAPVFQRLFGWLSLGLALPVLTISAADYWSSARLALRQKRLTLEVPISAGLAAIYAQSGFEIMTGRGGGYLDSMCGLVFFLLCGRAFQQKTHERLAFDRDFKSFFPLSAVRKTSSGTEEHVALCHLSVGDRLVLRHGELLPADARLEEGTALIDYSFVTGESEPAVNNRGDHLYAGGRQMAGAIEVVTVKPVSQSYLTSLWNHEAFQKPRSDDFTSLTNRYSRRFTRVVLTVALGAAVFWAATGQPWRGLKAFNSVLIVACPCALALAAPFALGTAHRMLARRGVFLKNAEVVERMARANALMFDKTGTLTTAAGGAAQFTGTPLSTAERSWTHSLARHSAHPHSSRIASQMADGIQAMPVTGFCETVGGGISGLIEGHQVLLGSMGWLASRGIHPDRALPKASSSVSLAIDGLHRGSFDVENHLRPRTELLVKSLQPRYSLALLSGDNDRQRSRFRGLFGAEAELLFNQSPLDKLNQVRRLQAAGRTVLMVGDGLNDAGALKQSDVGVAVVEKTGSFSPASDVILEAGLVEHIDKILGFSRRAALIVRVSFGISSAYNLVGVGIAAAGLLSPLVCAVLMPISSITVVLFACGATRWAAGRAGFANPTTQP